MENLPLVSVLLLSMNHEKFIEQCINSLANQTYKNIEVLYLDNASSDNTYELGKSFLESSGLPFKDFKNYESRGISKNLNFLLSQSSGVYVSPLSADDWFKEDNIEKKVELISENEEIGAVFSNGWEFAQEAQELTLQKSNNFKRGMVYKEILSQPDSIFYVGLLYRKNAIVKIGGWDENLIIEDVDLFVRLTQRYSIDFLETPLVYYRRSSQSMSKNIDIMLEGKQQYYKKFKNEKWINMKWWLSDQYRRMAARSIHECKIKYARKYLLQAIKIYPYSISHYRTLFYLIRKYT